MANASAQDEDETRAATALGRGFMLWQIANGWQRAARAALSDTGLTYVQVLMLAGLTDRLAEGAKVSQALLAQSLGADAMMTSQVLRTLEAAGLIQRERDPGDTRARTLAITEKGAVLLAQALPLLQSAEDTFFDPLGKKEERFTKTLRKLWRKRRHIGMPNAEQPEAKVVELSDEQAKRRRSSRKHAPVGVE